MRKSLLESYLEQKRELCDLHGIDMELILQKDVSFDGMEELYLLVENVISSAIWLDVVNDRKLEIHIYRQHSHLHLSIRIAVCGIDTVPLMTNIIEKYNGVCEFCEKDQGFWFTAIIPVVNLS